MKATDFPKAFFELARIVAVYRLSPATPNEIPVINMESRRVAKLNVVRRAA